MTFPNPWGEHPPAEADRDRAIRLSCLHMALHLHAESGAVTQTEEDGPGGLIVAKPVRDHAAVIDTAKAFHEFVETSPGVSPHRVALEEIRRELGDQQEPGERAEIGNVRAIVRGALGLGR